MTSLLTPEESVCTVSELNRLARVVLERGMTVCRVRGEIANFSKAGSGHWYFTLKDSLATVRCVMFKTRNQFVDWQPRDGDQVELRAQATLYEQRGDFQLQVEALRKGGLGSLFEAFIKLKTILEAEGLFDPGKKKPIPPIPRRIGIITSPQAAALRDVLSTLARRWPAVTAILYPTPVQGIEGAKGLVRAIQQAGIRLECDVVLVVRGGGSLEDLSCFNDESVARALAACPIPVISGVGHETDFTIVDFVADHRAPTPTGAAESATPSRPEWINRLTHVHARLQQAESRLRQAVAQRLDSLRARLVHPHQRIEIRRQQWLHLHWRLISNQQIALRSHRQRHLDLQHTLQGIELPSVTARNILTQLSGRLANSQSRRVELHQNGIRTLTRQLDMLNPRGVLRRGYSIVRAAGGGKIVYSAEEVEPAQILDVVLGHGQLLVSVKKSVKLPE